MDDTLVLVNPRAGSGRAARTWRELRERPEVAAGCRVVEAPDAAAARDVLDAALSGEAGGRPRRVVAVGGDGTAHLAANRIHAAGCGARVALGMVPAGTGSDLARNLGLPADPAAALGIAVRGVPSPVDLIEVRAPGETRVVLNVASAGISGIVTERVNARSRRGHLTYLAATLGALRAFRPFRARVAVDGEPWMEGEVFLLAVANGASFGKGMRVAPRATMTDGFADVVLARPIPWALVPLKLPRLYTGSVLAIREVSWRRGREVTLEPGGPLPPLELDGETIASGPTRFTVLPGALLFQRGEASRG